MAIEPWFPFAFIGAALVVAVLAAKVGKIMGKQRACRTDSRIGQEGVGSDGE